MSVEPASGAKRARAPLSALTLRADAPVPARAMTLFVAIWLGLSWVAAWYLGPGATALVLMAGVLCFWLLVPKAPTSHELPGWAIVPLGLAFVAGLFGAAYMAELDRDLLPAGYGLWFVLWLQFGLWLKHRYGR